MFGLNIYIIKRFLFAVKKIYVFKNAESKKICFQKNEILDEPFL